MDFPKEKAKIVLLVKEIKLNRLIYRVEILKFLLLKCFKKVKKIITGAIIIPIIAYVNRKGGC